MLLLGLQANLNFDKDTGHFLSVLLLFFFGLGLVSVWIPKGLGLVSASVLSSIDNVSVSVGWCRLDCNTTVKSE